MMKKKVKGVLCALVMGVCVCGTVLSVAAQTVHFDITIPGDVISKRALKADSVQKFYVTGTEFHQSGWMSCVSTKLDDHSVQSYYTEISQSSPRSNADYRSYAEPNKYYFMSGSSNVNGFHACGNYTP